MDVQRLSLVKVFELLCLKKSETKKLKYSKLSPLEKAKRVKRNQCSQSGALELEHGIQH